MALDLAVVAQAIGRFVNSARLAFGGLVAAAFVALFHERYNKPWLVGAAVLFGSLLVWDICETGGKWVAPTFPPKITGRVVDVQADISDGRLLLGKQWDYVSCNEIPKDQFLHVRKGEMVTVLCNSVGEVLGDAVASDCITFR